MNELGKQYEDVACKYLEKKGYTILMQNYFSRYGEIDIIAKDGEYTVFAEVKYRKDNSFSNPLEAISKSKLNKMYKTAQCYTQEYGDDFYRFDAIIIENTHIDHIENILSV